MGPFAFYAQLSSRMDDPQDKFDAYNLLEFSTADFAHIDATTTREHDDDRHATTSSTLVVVASDSAGGRRVRVGTSTSGSGGP